MLNKIEEMKDDLRGTACREFGTNLLRYRTAMKISRRELSRRTGIGQDIIVNIENGRSGIKLDYAEKIAEALGLRLGDFLTLETSDKVAGNVSFGKIQKEIRQLYSNIAMSKIGIKKTTSMLAGIVAFEEDAREKALSGADR